MRLGHGGHDRAREVEAGGGVDRAAWSALGVTGLLAAISAGDGGVVGASEVASALGREVVSLPAYALLTALALLGGVGLDPARRSRIEAGDELITLAFFEEGISQVAAARTQGGRRPHHGTQDGRTGGGRSERSHHCRPNP